MSNTRELVDSLLVGRPAEPPPRDGYRLDHRLYLDAEGRPTTSEEEGVGLLGIKGDVIAHDLAVRLGLVTE